MKACFIYPRRSSRYFNNVQLIAVFALLGFIIFYGWLPIFAPSDESSSLCSVRHSAAEDDSLSSIEVREPMRRLNYSESTIRHSRSYAHCSAFVRQVFHLLPLSHDCHESD